MKLGYLLGVGFILVNVAYAVKTNGSVECAGCEYLVEALEGFVTKNTTETEVVSFLTKFCQYIPKQYASTCVMFVKTYAKAILDYIVQAQPPELVCEELTLC